jgi:hypothetical protein
MAEEVRFRSPGLGPQGSGAGFQVQVQELCHLSSVIDSALNAALPLFSQPPTAYRQPPTAIR